MFRIYISLCIFFIAGSCLQAQHFDELYNIQRQNGPEKTWRDSGYYFVPTVVRFDVLSLSPGGSEGVVAADVTFNSTDNSGLTFSGQATFLYRHNNLPMEVTIGPQTNGVAVVLLPQDLLFCPDDEQEQGMGQDDPYFPLFLAGRYLRIGQQWLDPTLLIMVQLNDFVVN